MNSKERAILVAILSAQLGPWLDRLAVPKDSQPEAISWVVMGLFAGYHLVARFVETYGPRIMARWFPASPTQPPAR